MRRAALFACVLREHESQLYGNGCQGGGGALPNRCLNQSHSAQMLKIREACLLSNPLNPDSTRSLCSDTEGRSGATWLRLPFILRQLTPLLSNVPQRDPPATASLPSVTSLCGEVLQVGCSCLQSQEGALRSRMWVACVCESLLCVLRAGISWMSDSLVLSRIGKLTNIWPWFFLPSGTQGTLG